MGNGIRPDMLGRADSCKLSCLSVEPFLLLSDRVHFKRKPGVDGTTAGLPHFEIEGSTKRLRQSGSTLNGIAAWFTNRAAIALHGRSVVNEPIKSSDYIFNSMLASRAALTVASDSSKCPRVIVSVVPPKAVPIAPFRVRRSTRASVRASAG